MKRFKEGTIRGYFRTDGLVGLRNLLLVVSMSDLTNEVVARIAECSPNAVSLLTPTGGLSYGEELERVHGLRAGICTNPNIGAILLVGTTLGDVEDFAAQLRAAGRRVEVLDLVREVDSNRAICNGLRKATALLAALERDPKVDAKLYALRVAVRSSSSSAESLRVVNPVVGRAVDVLLALGGTVGFTELADLAGEVDLVVEKAATPDVAERIRDVLRSTHDLLVDLAESAPDPTATNVYGGIESLRQKSLGALYRLGKHSIESVFGFGGKMPRGGLHMMEGPGSAAISLIGLAAAGCNILIYTVGMTSVIPSSPIMPAVKVGPPNLRESRDIDISVRAENEEPDEIIQTVLRIASGESSVAELSQSRFLMLPNYLAAL